MLPGRQSLHEQKKTSEHIQALEEAEELAPAPYRLDSLGHRLLSVRGHLRLDHFEWLPKSCNFEQLYVENQCFA